MRIVAINGSYRKGRTNDFLIDRAIDGVRSVDPEAEVEKITLIDRKIEYCRNCMVCRNDDPAKPVADCVIDDDMKEIYPLLERADGYIIATPVNMASVTALLKTFLERVCWVLAKPGRRPLPGCPVPRTERKKRLVVIVSSGLIPPLLRRFCDNATALIKDVGRCSLGARTVGSLYAGAVEKRGGEYYSGRAFRLGRRLAGK